MGMPGAVAPFSAGWAGCAPRKAAGGPRGHRRPGQRWGCPLAAGVADPFCLAPSGSAAHPDLPDPPACFQEAWRWSTGPSGAWSCGSQNTDEAAGRLG